MVFRACIYLLLHLLLTASTGLAQVELNIKDFERQNNIIMLNLEITNKTSNAFNMKEFQTKLNAIDYYTIEGADTINYEGMSFLVSNGKKYLDVKYFPMELKYRSKRRNWVDLLWVKVGNYLFSNVLRIDGNSKKKIIINIDGLELSAGEYYFQIVYHLSNADHFIASNNIRFRYP